MMMATCQRPCSATELCIIKSPRKKSGELEPARPERARAARSADLAGRRRVLHHLFQHLEIVEIAAAPLCRDPADGLRPVVIVALLDLDEARLVEHLQVAAQIAVRQGAHLLQIAEYEPLGMRHQ